MKWFYNGYLQAYEEGKKWGLDVFFGWEYYIRRAEFLTYGLDLDFLLKHPELVKLPIEKYSKLIRDNGGYIVQAHPLRYNKIQDPRYLDGFEIWNSSESDENNDNAKRLCRQYGLNPQAGSDSHGDYLSFASGITLEKKATSIHDIISSLKDGSAKPIVPEP